MLKRRRNSPPSCKEFYWKPIADPLIQKDSRLTHLYGYHARTNKKKLAVYPIHLSVSNKNLSYKLVSWLDENLKPLSINDYTVTDIFSFADDLHEMKIDQHDNLVLYNVLCLFTNVPVDETVKIKAEKAFKDALFNKEYDLNITKTDLLELLEVATKNQLF